MNLKVIMGRQKHQAEKECILWFHLEKTLEKCKQVYSNRSRSMVTWGWEGGVKRDRRNF